MKKFSTLLILFWSWISVSHAQQDTITFFGKSNYIFEHLDKEQITTGLMSEYGIPFINVSDYNGTAVSKINYATLQQWRLLYASLYSLQINAKIGMEPLEAINEKIHNLVSRKRAITFALMNYRYQSIREDALNKNLITVHNDQLYDVPARTQSPYQLKRMFAVAPLNQTAFTGKNTIIFSPEMYFGNYKKDIRSISIDLGETGTFRNIRYSTPSVFSFPKPGFVPIAVRITYSDGETVIGHTGIRVHQSPGKNPEQRQTAQKTKTKTETFSQSQNRPITALKPFMGQLANGNISIRFGKGNLNKSIRKPLIVIREVDFEHIHSRGSSEKPLTALSANTVLKDINLRSIPGIPDTYDIIYLNLSDPTDYIQRNAYLLERTIDYINTSKTTYQGRRQENVVLGLGTGGLIARYALRDMELSRQNHQTRVFISYDTPHHGLNIPAGYQAAVQHLANFAFFMTGPSTPSPVVRYIRWADIFPEILHTRDIYDTPAARQVIIQRYFLNQQNHRLSPDYLSYQNFYSELDSMGWPIKTNNFVMSSGSDKGIPLHTENSPFVAFNGNKGMTSDIPQKSKTEKKRTLASEITQTINHTAQPFSLELPSSHYSANSGLKVYFMINPVPENETSAIYSANISIKRNMPWVKNPENLIMKISVDSTPDMLPLDNAPGSPLTINTTIDHLEKPFSRTSRFTNSPGKRRQLSQFCFVPTVSALGIIDPWRNLKKNISKNIVNVSPETINGHFSPDLNQEHLSYTQSSINQILQWQDTVYDDKK
jgi:hypothetical protein